MHLRCHICRTKRRNSIWDSGLNGKVWTEICHLLFSLLHGGMLLPQHSNCTYQLFLETFSGKRLHTHILPFKDHFPLAPGNLDQCHLIFGKNSFWHSFGIIWVGELSCLKPFESRDCSHEQPCPAHLFTVSWDEPDQLVLLRPLPGNQDWACCPLYNYMLEWAPVLALPPMPIVMGCLRRCSRDILVPPCIGWPPYITSLIFSQQARSARYPYHHPSWWLNKIAMHWLAQRMFIAHEADRSVILSVN